MKLWLEPFYDLVNQTPKDTEVIVSTKLDKTRNVNDWMSLFSIEV